jgi:GDP-4-dehydro-6-deoxy-D-mannose reductase
MKVLLTGATGFVGNHVQAQLDSVSLVSANGKPIELMNVSALNQRVAELNFDAVIHLAAQSFVPESFANPKQTFDVNFIGTFNLLSAMKSKGFKGKFLFVSSGDVYGKVSEQVLPVTEKLLPKPGNPYAVSKLAAEALCYQWSQTEGMHIIIARPFNHIGPGQRDSFAVSSFAKQIAEIKLGLRENKLEVGDIDTTRDFADVRDIVRAYELLLSYGHNGEIYNVCSGTEFTLREMINRMLALSGVEATVHQDSKRLRISDQRRVRGDNTKLHRDTGWKPLITLEKTLQDLLVYWEKQLHG